MRDTAVIRRRPGSASKRTAGAVKNIAGIEAQPAPSRVLNALQPGEIVLMHVGAANDATTLDADALPTLINELRARGYALVLVSSYV
jgi:peptidoglycan/xylan/chitin deacetylase (PgdA/CDA1 family)